MKIFIFFLSLIALGLCSSIGIVQSQNIVTVTTQFFSTTYYTTSWTSSSSTSLVFYNTAFTMQRPSFSACSLVKYPVTLTAGQRIVGGFAADQMVYLYVVKVSGSSCITGDYKAVALVAAESTPTYKLDWTAETGGTYYFTFMYPDYNAMPIVNVSFWASTPLPPTENLAYSTATSVTIVRSTATSILTGQVSTTSQSAASSIVTPQTMMALFSIAIAGILVAIIIRKRRTRPEKTRMY